MKDKDYKNYPTTAPKITLVQGGWLHCSPPLTYASEKLDRK